MNNITLQNIMSGKPCCISKQELTYMDNDMKQKQNRRITTQKATLKRFANENNTGQRLIQCRNMWEVKRLISMINKKYHQVNYEIQEGEQKEKIVHHLICGYDDDLSCQHFVSKGIRTTRKIKYLRVWKE